MATRMARGAPAAWLGGLLASALAVPALAASETTAERLLDTAAEPQNWLTHHKDYAATRYSTLDEINKDNVQGLKVAWTFALGGIEGGGIWPHGGLEGTPIVEDGFMYVTDGWGSVYKLDITRAARASWSGRWTRAPTRTGRARCPAAASTTAASRCGRTRSSRTPWTAA